MLESTTNQPEYTIGIPCYNDSKNLHNLLSSLENQKTSFEFNVLIIDDCSNKILKLKHDFNLDVKIQRNQKNLGPGVTRNKILNQVDSKYLLFLDSDSLFPTDKILQRLYESKDLADITYPLVRDDLDVIVHPWELYNNHPTMMICTQIKLHKIKNRGLTFRNVFDFFCEDMCFFFEAQKKGISTHYCSEIEILHTRATTATCPVRLTSAKHSNLIFGYMALRFLFPGKVLSNWCSVGYIINIFKRNFLAPVKDEEYMRILHAIFIFLRRLPRLIFIKYGGL